jgi:hypothetical protein
MKRSLDDELSRLARDVPPPRDLWPAIEKQIRPARRWRPVALWSAAAAVAVVSSVLTLLLVHQQSSSPPGTRPAALSAATFEAPRDPAFVAARAQLEKTFRQRLQLLQPETRVKVEKSLQTIRQANADIREALSHDPASPVLQQLLESTWQQEIDLYESVNQTTEPLLTRT